MTISGLGTIGEKRTLKLRRPSLKVVTAADAATFETAYNDFVKDLPAAGVNKEAFLVDVQFTHTDDGTAEVYTAFILYLES